MCPTADDEPDRLLAEIAHHWSDARHRARQDDALPEFLRNPTLANLVGEGSGIVVQVLDMRRFKSVYVSPNVEEVCGYTPDEIQRGGVTQFLRNLSLRELLLHVKNARLIARVRRTVPPRTQFRSCLINGTMRTKARAHLRIVAQHFTVEWDEKGGEKFSLFLWRDTTHLFKSTDVVWRHEWRVAGGTPVIWTYSPSHGRFAEQDLFTARELEVIQGVVRGQTSKEIGEDLGISPLTVENHRKNAIQRLQVKNTEGLVDVCKWLKLL